MIVGNKLDIGDAPSGRATREVSTEEGQRYAKTKGCLFLGECLVVGDVAACMCNRG
jgi:hypothetical protein